jgi:hypothetical protein
MNTTQEFRDAYYGMMGMYDAVVESGRSPREAASLAALATMTAVEVRASDMDGPEGFVADVIGSLTLTRHQSLYKEKGDVAE